MARPRSTPSPATAEEVAVATPLQKILVASFLWALILVPLSGFVFYLAPIGNAFPNMYRGDFFVIGVAIGIVASFVLSFLWMTFLPRLLERRAERQKREGEKRREKRKAAAREERESE